MDKEDVVHIYNGMLLRHKKNEIVPFSATRTDLEIIILSEVRQRKKSIVKSLICGIYKNDTSELIYKMNIDSQT